MAAYLRAGTLVTGDAHLMKLLLLFYPAGTPLTEEILKQCVWEGWIIAKPSLEGAAIQLTDEGLRLMLGHSF